MILFLKKYFIPCSFNSYKPYILRTKSMLVILAMVILLQLVFYFGSFILLQKTDFLASILPSIVVEATNKNRVSSNVGELQVSPLLEKAALLKAEDMVKYGYFSHNSPDGKTPWHWLNKVDYAYVYAGENLAVNFFDSEEIVSAWMNSLGHRQNILNGNYTEIGLGTARGEYQGHDTIFVVQFFGTPIQRNIQKDAVLKENNEKESISYLQNTRGESAIEVSGSIPQESFARTENVQVSVKSDDKNHMGFSFLAASLLTLPSQFINIFYIAIFLIILAALLPNILIKIGPEKQRFRNIFNGAVMLMVIGSLYIFNHFFIFSQGNIL